MMIMNAFLDNVNLFNLRKNCPLGIKICSLNNREILEASDLSFQKNVGKWNGQ